MIAYLHGMPGSSAELGLFGDSPSIPFFIPDRFDRKRLGDRYDALAHSISERDPGCRIRLVAFSLGARPALEVAARLGSRVASVDLIAPAGSLAVVDRSMAGYPVFVMARDQPLLFDLMTRLQATLARIAPSLLCAGLLKTARGADLALLHEPGFRARMADMLAQCFSDDGRTTAIRSMPMSRPGHRCLQQYRSRSHFGTAHSTTGLLSRFQNISLNCCPTRSSFIAWRACRITPR